MKLKHLTGLVMLACTQPAPANIDIHFNYTYDSAGFFAEQARRDVLEAAASVFESRFTDSLDAVNSSGPNNFSTIFFNPSDPFAADIALSSQNIAMDVVLVYAGGADLGGGTLGLGGPGGFSCSGVPGFCSDAALRGQGATSGANAVDVAPWGGSISFNAATNWNFSVSSGPGFSQYDFYSVAVHELAHLLGFGTSPSFQALVSGGTFNGPTTGGVALFGDESHWVPGTLSTVNGEVQEAAMDPDIANGQRKHFTDLDFAAMSDIGWQVTPIPEADTWVMMIAGLGLVGVAVRRCKRCRSSAGFVLS